MPLDPTQLQQLAQGYVQKKKEQVVPAPDFAIPKPKSIDQEINAMPNADKLTLNEKKIYGALPGITTWMENTRIRGTTVSEQLDKFNNSWPGKALNFLDIFAEGFERTSGLVEQMATDPDFDTEDLKAAWYAGSLTYDTTNLPTFKRDKDKKIIGMQIPTDLPGSSGLNAQRAEIQRLMQQGVDPKAALAQVKDKYYNGLGALTLRAQLNDTYGHVLLDPLNFVAAYLKPLEALKARRFVALTSKLTGGVEEVLTKADDVARLAKAAGTVEEALAHTDEAYRLAQLAGDTKLAAKYGAEAAELAKAAGKAEDVSRYTGEAGRFASMTAEDATAFSDDALKALGKKQITKLDKVAIMLTGGDPFRPSKLGQAFEKIPGLGKVAKAFQLTPASKAQELLTMLGDNIGSNVIARMINNPNAEADFVNYIRRVGNGATGIEYGHAFMSLEGRTVQGFIKGVDTDLGRMLKTYEEIAPQRNLLGLVSQTMGVSPEKILTMADDNPTALLQALAKNGAANPALAAMLQTGELTPDSLRAMGKIVSGVAYNKEMFFAQALDAIETTAMRQAVVQFGVKSKGVITRWSEAIKAAESLAFLKLNPGYPIRNMINNEITMLSRGVFGVFGPDSIDNFWKDFGVVPKRLGEALTPAGEQFGKAEKLSEAQRILDDALRGGEWGTADKAKEFFQKLNIGKLDSTKFGFRGKTFEQIASKRAQTVGTMQFLRRYFKPKGSREYINPKVMDAIADLSPEFERHLDNAIRASGAIEGKFDKLLGTNLNVNIDSILDDVTEKIGVDVRQVLGDEVLETLHQKLPDAIEKGTLDAFNLEMRSQINRHIDDLFQKQIDNVIEHTKAQAVAGGPNVWNKKLGDAQDIFWGAHIEHAQRMPEATRLAREASSAGDFAAARSLWAKEAEDSRLFFDRAFRRVDAYVEGLEQGTAELAARGAKLPFTETKRTFREWKGMWENFFTEKNKILDEFFSKEGGDFTAVQKQLDKMYQDAIEKEDNFSLRLDETIANMMPDPQAKAAYTNARDALAEMRRADKTKVAAMRNELADLPANERQAKWNQFWQERSARMQEMRSVDAAARAIQEGDPNAVQMFSQAVPGEPKAGQSIYDIANEYGISSASPSGKRSDKRILNTVNKYAPKEDIEKALQKYTEQAAEEAAPTVEKGKKAKRGADAFMNETLMYDGVPTTRGEIMADLKKRGGTPQMIDRYMQGLELKKSMKKVPTDKFTFVDDIPEDVARQAFEARAAEKGTVIAQKQKGVSPSFILDVQKVIPEPQPIDLSMDLMTYGRTHAMLDEITAGAKTAAQKTPTMLKDLPAELQDEIRKGVGQIKNDFASTRYQALKFGEWRRDSALLNYNRRTNFDNSLAHIAPFAFWSTSSMFQWAVESIDRPAMLTNYLRAKKFLATSGLQRDGQATRTKGKIRIELPFAPEWMGEQFVDPLRLALPFDNWMAPFEQFQKDQSAAEGRTERLLEQMVKEGKVSQEDYEEAVAERSGATWDYAEAQTKANDDGDRYDAWDFATSMASPHAPIMWAYNAAFGDKEDIGPFSPLSRITRNAATMMGVEDWNNSKWNLEAKVRKQMGLSAYDKWDDYRIDRSLSNLAGDGSYTPDEVKEALAISALVQSGKMTPEDAKKQSEAYREGVKRSNQEYTGGAGAFALGLLGISVTSVPQGENNLRRLQDDFGMAYQQYKSANDSLETYLADHADLDPQEATAAWEKKNPKLAKDGDALTQFFDDHPEYETRLGLFDPPEKRLHTFMIDEIWKHYNELPKVNQDEVREHLGTDFQEAFLNKETRSYDDVPTETMSVWLKMMRVDPLGGLTADQRLLVNLYGKVKFTDPETANRVEVFYDSRKQNFPEFYDLQSGYYELKSKTDKKKYLRENPELKQYWDFRSSFMRDNPDLLSYLTDDEKAIAKAKYQARTKNAVPTAKEIQIQLPPALQQVIRLSDGGKLPPAAERELEHIASQNNLTLDQLEGILGLP
jgi:hypothetical protein